MKIIHIGSCVNTDDKLDEHKNNNHNKLSNILNIKI